MVVTSASSSFSLHCFFLSSFKCCELKMQTFAKERERYLARCDKKRGKAKMLAHFFGFYNELIHELMTKKRCVDACLQLRALIKNCFLSSFESNLEVSSTLPGCEIFFVYHQSERTWTFLGRDCDSFVDVFKHASIFMEIQCWNLHENSIFCVDVLH